MFLAMRGLPALLEIGLLIFCLIEVIQTPADETRNLSKVWWIILIIFVPLIGGIAWLVAGRPVRPRTSPKWRMGSGFPEPGRYGSPAPKGPDDDAEFLNEMKKVNNEQEETLRRWEEDLRRREAEQRKREGKDE